MSPHHQLSQIMKKMRLGGTYILIVSVLGTCVLCEGENKETRLVFGIKGGNVTLLLNIGVIEDISWGYDGDVVRVSTRPGEPIKVRDPNHKGNMLATEDGSLVIMNLTQEDEKVYSASLQLKATMESFTIHYDLRVFKMLSAEDIQLEHNATSADPCAVYFKCVVKEHNVSVTWTTNITHDVIGKVVYIADARSTSNITCRAQNPISNITRTVTPSEFCAEEESGGKRKIGIGAAVAAALVALGIAGFLIWIRNRQTVGEPVTEQPSMELGKMDANPDASKHISTEI